MWHITSTSWRIAADMTRPDTLATLCAIAGTDMNLPRRRITSALKRSGFAVRSLLDGTATERLRVSYGALAVAADAEMYRSFADEARPLATQAHCEITAVVAEPLRGLLPGHRVVLSTFISKGSGGGALDIHQDWTFTDERSHRAIIAWIPLVGVSEANGAMIVVAGSHRWTSGIRCSTREVEGATVHLQSRLVTRARPVPLHAGDVLLYDSAILHGSSPNVSTSPRPAAVIMMLPNEAPVLHFHETAKGVRGWVVDPSFFTTSEFESEPAGYPGFDPWAAPVRAHDICTGLNRRRLTSRATNRPSDR